MGREVRKRSQSGRNPAIPDILLHTVLPHIPMPAKYLLGTQSTVDGKVR